MSDEWEYRALSECEAPGEAARMSRLDPGVLEAVGTVALCDVDHTPTENVLPSISMSITQFVQLVDGSLVRLAMDRGYTSVHHGPNGEAVSWQRPLAEVVQEVLDLVRADDPADPMAHPWEELAEAARVRGVDVDARTLSGLPYRVVLTTEAVATFVG